MLRSVTAEKHPAPFSEPIVETLRRLLPMWVPTSVLVHDPFAGEGVRLGRLCDQLGYTFSGSDLELWRDGDRRVVLGDATDAASYPTRRFVVVTSPTYNNGVNDHFVPRDVSDRMTYRVAAGHELHENNTGRYSGRGSKAAEHTYWRITRESVAHWPELTIVNVKDSMRGRKLYPFVELWRALLIEHGYSLTQLDVPCPGWRVGTNHEARVETEAIIVARRGHRAPWAAT